MPVAGEDSSLQTPSIRYGWLSWRPDCIQWLNSVRWFVACACISSFAHTMGLGMISVSTSSIETRYGLSSSQVGLVTSIYEFSGIFVLILVGLIANYANKPRWLAWGMVCITISNVLYTLPHFIGGEYVYEATVPTDEEWCVINDTNRTDYCSSDEGSSSSYLAFFYTSAVFFALGSVPMYIYTIAYIDDSAIYTRGAFYIAVFISMACFGPALAFIGGGSTLFLYVDIGRVDPDSVEITPEDPRWVGAWWIGFLVASMVAFIDIIPLLGYPRNPPYKKWAAEKTDQAVTNGQAIKQDSVSNGQAITKGEETARDELMTAHLGLRDTLISLPKYIKKIYTNGPYVFLMLSGASDGFLITGFTAFGVKYIETQFSLSPGTAGALFGITVLPGALGGTIFGGWLIRKRRLSPLQMLKVIFINNVIINLFGFIFFMGCDTAPFAGVTTSDQTGLACGLAEACNCTEIYDPMCGSDGIIYFSSCHAGCLTPTAEEGLYANCTCVGEYLNGTVTSGVCPVPECHMLAPFLILLLIPMFCLFVGLMSHTQAVLRTVAEEHRSLALSLDWVFARLFGTVPGPIVFALLIDSSCLLWDEKCGERGECLYYDNQQMGLYMLACCAVAKIPAAFFSFISYYLFKRNLAKNDKVKKLEFFNEIEVKASSDLTNGHVNDTKQSINGQVIDSSKIEVTDGGDTKHPAYSNGGFDLADTTSL